MPLQMPIQTPQMYPPMYPQMQQQMPFIPIPSEPKSTPDVNITLVTGNNNKVTGEKQKAENVDVPKEPVSTVNGGAIEEKKEEPNSGVFDFAKSFFIKKTG
jgi:hypothetical protein